MEEIFKKCFSEISEIHNNLQRIYISLIEFVNIDMSDTIEFFQKQSLICSTIISILQIEKVSTVKKYVEKARKQIKIIFKKYGDGTIIGVDFNNSKKDLNNVLYMSQILKNLERLPSAIESLLEHCENEGA